ncbi:hypothetical protein TWF506_008035 [Arthrobotrys conoides]|uniref:Uncharacterized protein n=1 Tax=Arthrobotrys conoides TaxID=74498 RepID=A0AAN8NCJ6_9PEZI
MGKQADERRRQEVAEMRRLLTDLANGYTMPLRSGEGWRHGYAVQESRVLTQKLCHFVGHPALILRQTLWTVPVKERQEIISLLKEGKIGVEGGSCVIESASPEVSVETMPPTGLPRQATPELRTPETRLSSVEREIRSLEQLFQSIEPDFQRDESGEGSETKELEDLRRRIKILEEERDMARTNEGLLRKQNLILEGKLAGMETAMVIITGNLNGGNLNGT